MAIYVITTLLEAQQSAGAASLNTEHSSMTKRNRLHGRENTICDLLYQQITITEALHEQTWNVGHRIFPHGL